MGKYPGIVYHKDFKHGVSVHQGPDVDHNNKCVRIVQSEAEHKHLGPDWGYEPGSEKPEVQEEMPVKRGRK